MLFFLIGLGDVLPDVAVERDNRSKSSRLRNELSSTNHSCMAVGYKANKPHLTEIDVIW